MGPGGQGGQPGQGGQGGARGTQPQTGNPGANPGGSPGGQGRPGMGGGRGAGGVEDMLERSPNISAADLKVGDTIALSSTKTPDMARIKAIKLFAGVEPFLRAAQATSGRGGRGGQGGVDGGFSIPGLDGIGFP